MDRRQVLGTVLALPAFSAWAGLDPGSLAPDFPLQARQGKFPVASDADQRGVPRRTGSTPATARRVAAPGQDRP